MVVSNEIAAERRPVSFENLQNEHDRKSGNRFSDKIMLKCKEAARVSAGDA